MSKKIMHKRIVGILFCALGISVAALAQNNTHTVKAGETLYSIAQQYDVSVGGLKNWNDLETSVLEIGQVLVIRAERRETGETVTHIVQTGETLFSISKQYGVTIMEIRSWNNLSGNNLSIGQELIMHPGKTGESMTSHSSGKSIVVSSDTQNNTYYTVKSGDTLYRIARQHNMTVNELKQLNDLSSNAIGIGQRLTVNAVSAPPSVAAGSAVELFPQGKFITYRAGSTQSLEEVLKKFDMTKIEFKILNPDFTSGDVQQGQKVTVLAPPSQTYVNPYRTGASLTNLGKTIVSRYSASETGTTTTSGELYNPDELTAGHSNIAVGTVMYIQNPRNSKGVYIRINDRISGDGLKLSEAVWQVLDFSSPNPSVNIYQDQ